MIRINLIGERKRAPSARTPRVSSAIDLGSWLLLGLVVLGLIVAVGQWWLLDREVATKAEEVAAAQREADELAPIIEEVQRFKESKAELERKISIINDLKANQRGPVRIMGAISLALPDLLWLNRMDVRAGLVTLAGEATNTNAVANFIDNLDRVPEFQEPVLKDVAQQGQNANRFTFTITFNFAQAASAAEAATTGG